MESEPIIKYVKEGSVGVITLNRPDRYNSVNYELTKLLTNTLIMISADDDVRAVVVHGEGPGFCAGADIESFKSGITPIEVHDYLISVYKPMMKVFFSLRKPIIGAIHGSAAGVGAAIALACDLRVMGESANLLYAFINIGIGPDGGASWLLSRQIGYSRAFQIAIEGKPVSAHRCLDLGLTNKIVADGDELLSAMEWAHKLAKRPTLAVGITKLDMHHAEKSNIFDTIEFEANEQIDAIASHDFKEGVSAFLEKRKPQFKGK